MKPRPMETKDIYYLFTGLFMLIGGIVSLSASHFNLKGENALLKQDLFNQKSELREVKESFATHKDKVEDKLDGLSEKIAEIRELLAHKN